MAKNRQMTKLIKIINCISIFDRLVLARRVFVQRLHFKRIKSLLLGKRVLMFICLPFQASSGLTLLMFNRDSARWSSDAPMGLRNVTPGVRFL